MASDEGIEVPHYDQPKFLGKNTRLLAWEYDRQPWRWLTRQLGSMGTSQGKPLPSWNWKRMPTTVKSITSLRGNGDLGSSVCTCDPMSYAQLLPSPNLILSINEGSGGKNKTFIDPINPLNLGKITLEIHFGHSQVVFGHFTHFEHFRVAFRG